MGGANWKYKYKYKYKSHSVHSELFPQARESINFWEFTVT